MLDMNKVLMYKFHYDHIENKYGNNSRLLLTGTDSLMYIIKTEYVYEDFSKDKKSLILVIFQLSRSFMIIQTN